MSIEKARVPKSLQPKVEVWSKSLDISESEFVKEAIRFYVRYLEGKVPVIDSQLPVSPIPETEPVQATEDISDEDFTGDLDL